MKILGSQEQLSLLQANNNIKETEPLPLSVRVIIDTHPTIDLYPNYLNGILKSLKKLVKSVDLVNLPHKEDVYEGHDPRKYDCNLIVSTGLGSAWDDWRPESQGMGKVIDSLNRQGKDTGVILISKLDREWLMPVFYSNGILTQAHATTNKATDKDRSQFPVFIDHLVDSYNIDTGLQQWLEIIRHGYGLVDKKLTPWLVGSTNPRIPSIHTDRVKIMDQWLDLYPDKKFSLTHLEMLCNVGHFPMDLHGDPYRRRRTFLLLHALDHFTFKEANSLHRAFCSKKELDLSEQAYAHELLNILYGHSAFNEIGQEAHDVTYVPEDRALRMRAYNAMMTPLEDRFSIVATYCYTRAEAGFKPRFSNGSGIDVWRLISVIEFDNKETPELQQIISSCTSNREELLRWIKLIQELCYLHYEPDDIANAKYIIQSSNT